MIYNANTETEELKTITVAVNDTAFKLMEDYVTYNSCLSPFLRARFGKHPTGMKEKEYQSLVVTTFIKKMVYDNSDVDYDDLDF